MTPRVRTNGSAPAFLLTFPKLGFHIGVAGDGVDGGTAGRDGTRGASVEFLGNSVLLLQASFQCPSLAY